MKKIIKGRGRKGTKVKAKIGSRDLSGRDGEYNKLVQRVFRRMLLRYGNYDCREHIDGIPEAAEDKFGEDWSQVEICRRVSEW